jgi:hypothetical protein
MAQVPTYTPSVADRPILQQSINVQASGEDMGAAIGRGLQAVGQGVQQASRAVFEVQQLENQARAKEADDAFAAWIRERQYGEGGYMTLSGRAAVEGREAFEKELAEKRMSFGEGLQPGAATMYQGASMARLNSVTNSAVVHQAQERKVWMNDSANARKETFKSDALVNWNVPAAVDKNIAAGQLELREQGALLGWDADRLAREEALYVSGVRHDVALRMMSEDPLAAKAYIEQYRDQLTGEHQFKLDEALEVPLANAEGLKAAADFFDAGSARDPGQPNQGQGPTRAKAALYDRLVVPDRREDVDGLDGSFSNNLAALFDDAPFEGLGILSGARSTERQQELWDAALIKYGSEAEARKWVAPPGKSNHNHGQAVDLSYNGKSLKHAPPEVIEWVHANAGKYGLTFPMSWENWHIEPVTARGGTAVAATGVTTPRASAASRVQIEDYLDTIKDPRAREVARSAIMSRINAEAADADATRKAVQERAFSEMMTQNVSPYSFSPEVQSMIGREGMSNLMTYWDKVSSGEKIETDPQLLYAMSNAYATDPAGFADVDLTPYFAQLSDSDRDKVMGWQQTALTDQRKASEDGAALSSAFSAATTQLEAAGITTTGKTGDQRTQSAQQIAEFQMVLAQEIEAMRAANDGRAPTPIEVQQLINRLLLPVAIRGAGGDNMPGLIPNPIASLGRLFGGVDQSGFLFEVGTRPDGTTVEITMDYQDVPIDMRATIRSSLEVELGRTPTEAEIVDEYERFLLGE